jgi:hypothetical protein
MSAYIRGIGQYDFLPEFEPGVAIYFDDVLHPVTFASSVDLMDLERVEVLRGPQGTLFGRGSHRPQAADRPTPARAAFQQDLGSRHPAPSLKPTTAL